MILEALSYPFFQRALAAGVLASVVCGVVGTYVVVKEISSISGGLSHAAFAGVGLGYLLAFDPMLGALGTAVLAGLGLGLAYRRVRDGLDTLIAMVWAGGMALGILFVHMAPGYAPDLMSYLFGSILFVPPDYLRLVLALDVAVLLVVAALFKELRAVAFDEEFAETVRVPVEPIFLLLLVLASVAVVTLIRVVGVILVIALLTVPAAIARQWSDSLLRMMAGAAAIGTVCTVAGLFASYALDAGLQLQLPPGPLVIVFAVCAWMASSALRFAAARGRG